MSFTVDVVTALAKLIVRSSESKAWRQTIEFFGFQLTIAGPFDQNSVDERLEKIEIARQSLTDALDAVDSLRATAEINKRDLEG